jgi:hypothetical protein
MAICSDGVLAVSAIPESRPDYRGAASQHHLSSNLGIFQVLMGLACLPKGKDLFDHDLRLA